MLRSPVGAFLAFLALAVYTTWPLAPQASTGVVHNLTDPLEQAWIFAWTAHALPQAPLALFDANIFWPEPLTLAFTESFLGLTVPASPLFWLTDNALATYNLAMIASYAAGGWGVCLLVHRLGGSAGAGLVAGAAFGLAPYRLNQMSHPHVVAVHLLPVVLLVLMRLRDEPSRRLVVALGASVALQLWTSLTAGAMTLLVVGGWALWESLRLRRRALPVVGATVAGALLGLVLAAPLLLIYIEARAQHPEYSQSPRIVTDFSAEPASYLSPSPSGPVVRPLYELLDRNFVNARGAAEKHLFPGVWLGSAFLATVGAVGVAFLRRRRDGGTRPWLEPTSLFIWMALLGLVLSLGPHWGGRTSGTPLPFWLVTRVVPGNLLRVPARLASVVLLAMAVAVGLALSATRPRVRRALVAASALVLAAELAPGAFRMVEPPPLTAAHSAVAQLDGAVLALPTVELEPDRGVRITSLLREPVHMWLSTAHFRPITNGYAAFYPVSAYELAARVQDLPSSDAFAALRANDVQTVVVQTDMVEPTPWRDVVAELESWPGVAPVAESEGVRVFDISGAR